MPPKRRKTDTEESAESSIAPGSNSGVIRFEIDKVSELDDKGRFSPIVEVGGLPWKLLVRKEEDNLHACLHGMDNESTEWSIDVNAEYILVNSDSCKNVIEKNYCTYEHGANKQECRLSSLENLMIEEKGFIKTDKITVEIRISILKTNGIWVVPSSSSANKNRSDIILMNKSKTAFVNKQTLFPVAEATVNTADKNSSGFINFEISVSEIGTTWKLSPTVEVLGVPWNLNVMKSDNSPHLSIYLQHDLGRECNIWSIDTTRTFSLLSGSGEKIRSSACTFNHDDFGWGWTKFIPWNDLINEEKGFVKDGKITIESKFTLSNIVGIRTFLPIDFTDPNDPRHDITLLIEGEKVHVGKQILAFHSPVFNAMFYGNHIEKNKKEIELKKIDRKVFIEMLNLIYPSYQKITDDNAEPLLKMADYFQINLVIDFVEQFFIDSQKLEIASKLKLSDQYRLVKLQDHCFDTFETVQDIYDLKTSEIYKKLSDKAKSALMDKAMNLS